MSYKFIDNNGAFTVKNPHPSSAYFPLTNKEGTLLGSISPNLSGDIKKNNQSFLTPPASMEDLRGNLLTRRDFFIKINNKIIKLSELKTSSLEAGVLYHKTTKKFGSLTFETLNFIPSNQNC